MAPRSSSAAAGPPTSPSKRTLVLPDIPEANPGPNAFARQAVQKDKYRQEGNAFYQREVQQRNVTPLMNASTTSRNEDMSDLNTARTPRALSDTGASRMTSMSPFINAGTPNPLQLVPTGTLYSEPTERGYIEERREQKSHLASGSGAERTPVYTHTPKIKEAASSKPVVSTQRSFFKRDLTLVEQHKSPKKSIFERFRLRRSSLSSPSTDTLTCLEPLPIDLVRPLAPKAKAVLGSPTPPQGLLTRSLSTRQGFFSSRSKQPETANASSVLGVRRSFGLQPEDYDDQQSIEDTPSKAPQTAHPSARLSSPDHQHGHTMSRVENRNSPRYMRSTSTSKTSQTEYSDLGFQHRHFEHNTGLSQGEPRGEIAQAVSRLSNVTRSQSLKYFEHAIPPTPPAKNTPPGQKQNQNVPMTMPHALGLRSAVLPGFGSAPVNGGNTDQTSPKKCGGNREAPRLVTKPSTYSLHASVVPQATDLFSFEEMKARVDGLGLEGFSLPAETKHAKAPEMAYSPSVYNSEWQNSRQASFANTPVLQSAVGELPVGLKKLPTKKNSTEHSFSTSGTIPIWYPDLMDDRTKDNTTAPSNSWAPRSDSIQTGTPRHGRSRSCDTGSTGSPLQSIEAQLSAMGVDPESSTMNRTPPGPMMYPSATPSPLRILPIGTFGHPTTEGRAIENTLGHLNVHNVSAGTSTAAGDCGRTLSPARKLNPLDTAPVLESTPLRLGPHHNVNHTSNEHIDPPKPVSSPSANITDKLDEILAKLATAPSPALISAIREELRSNNARLSERLTAMEQHLHTPQPLTPSGKTLPPENTLTNKTLKLASQLHPGDQRTPGPKRVTTRFAEDFYTDYYPPPKEFTMPRPATGAAIGAVRPAYERTAKRSQLTVPAISSPTMPPSLQPEPAMPPLFTMPRMPPPVPTLPFPSPARPLSPKTRNLPSSPPEVAQPPTDTLAALQTTNHQLLEMVHAFTAKLENMEKRLSDNERSQRDEGRDGGHGYAFF